MGDLADMVREAREARGLSQAELARRLGVPPQSIQQLEAGAVKNPRYLVPLCSMLDLDFIHFSGDIDGDGPPPIVSSRRPGAGPLQVRIDRKTKKVFVENPPLKRPNEPLVGDADLPVYASAEGGPYGAITISSDPLEYVKRPSPLFSSPKGFGVFVTGESMEPAYEQGDIALVHAERPVQRDADALFVSVPDGKGDTRALIKRLISWTNSEWRVREYAPERRDFTLSRDDWPNAHLIVGKYARR